MTDKFACAWEDFKKVLENPDHDILRAEYRKYLQWFKEWMIPEAIPLSFNDWWRAAADEAKDRAKYKD